MPLKIGNKSVTIYNTARILKDLDSRDKICKLIQYLSKFLYWYFTTKYNSLPLDQINKMKELGKSNNMII